MKTKDTIFKKRYEGSYYGFKFGDLPKDLLPNDWIQLNTDDGFYSENESWDAYSELIVTRERDMTEQELEDFRILICKNGEENKRRRYQEYLRLKKEFET